MFKVGQTVVYPTQGVGNIEKIEEKEVLGKKQLYYCIKLDTVGMTVMVPVDKSEKARLRPISEDKSFKDILSTLENPCETTNKDWKIRYSSNNEKLKEGSIDSLAEVVRDLFHRNQIKELSKGEKKLFDSAFQLLCDELSALQEKDSNEIKINLLESLKSKIKIPA